MVGADDPLDIKRQCLRYTWHIETGDRRIGHPKCVGIGVTAVIDD